MPRSRGFRRTMCSATCSQPSRSRCHPEGCPMWLSAWFTPRFLWTLAAIALLLALSPGVPPFVPLAIALSAALAIATVADAAIGPPASTLRIARRVPEHFALAVGTDIAYTIENRSSREIRVGIVETPVRTLRYQTDELIATVSPGTRSTALRAVMPTARG